MTSIEMQRVINNFLPKKSQIRPKYFTAFTTDTMKTAFTDALPVCTEPWGVFRHNGAPGADAHRLVSPNNPQHVPPASPRPHGGPETLVGFGVLGHPPPDPWTRHMVSSVLERLVGLVSLGGTEGGERQAGQRFGVLSQTLTCGEIQGEDGCLSDWWEALGESEVLSRLQALCGVGAGGTRATGFAGHSGGRLRNSA